MEPVPERHRTEYDALTRGMLSARGAAPEFKFTGRLWTDPTCNRAAELKKGCGVYPRVWGDADARNSEVPITSREALRFFGTTSLAQHAGLTPRDHRTDNDKEVLDLKRAPVIWPEHDRERSECDRKVLRPMKVAGVNTARLGARKLHSFQRMGVDDRPPWMKEDETMPGGYHFAPAEPNGDPTRFGRSQHFSKKFGHKRGWGPDDATYKQRPR
eukprot:TRINITY_DN25639_c0_g1_i1.p1 TRINITY_DN25639_c0_g1~~TRINITY_DN25639_c0_g1_i1.p1  ORF type:complete len:214 (+),score=21.79 TRINITY_DN25639_c0_g1_i1:85-726(+)